jgi:hypothetical protein
VPCLPVVYRPPVQPVRKSFVQIGDCWSAYAYLDELTFIDEDLKIVPASFCENFCAHGGLEAVTFGRFCLETFWI